MSECECAFVCAYKVRGEHDIDSQCEAEYKGEDKCEDECKDEDECICSRSITVECWPLHVDVCLCAQTER